jgi:hypothetical protein
MKTTISAFKETNFKEEGQPSKRSTLRGKGVYLFDSAAL